MVKETTKLIAKLKNDRKRLDLILEGSNTGTWEWNIKSGKIVLNKKWAEIIGYSLKEINPSTIETWQAFVHPEDLKETENLFEKCICGDTDLFECEVRMKHKDGHWVWVLSRGAVFKRAADGDPLLMSGTHVSIDQFKECLKQKEEQEKRLLLALRVTRATVFEYDFLNDSLFVTPELFREIGFNASECPESIVKLMEFVYPEDKEAVQSSFSDYLEGRADHYHSSFRLRTKEEQWIWCDAVGEIIRCDDDGNPHKMLGIIKNIDSERN